VLHQARHGELKVQTNPEEWHRIRREIRRSNQRTFYAIVGSALLLSAAILIGLDGYAPRMWGGAPLLSWFFGLGGMALLLFNWPDKE
jgi:ubiquinone biosynthesis protein